jgi:hypothetical protein
MSNFGYTQDTAPLGLRDAYRADPNAEYGSMLLYAIDPCSKTIRFAMPSFARDSLLAGFAAPLLPVPAPGFDARPEPGLAERAAWLRRMNEVGSWQ